MATEFAMPTPSMGLSAPYTSSPSQYSLFGTQSQPISPASSTNTTPHNASPTSPRSDLVLPTNLQQLRPKNPPLFMPAVLRATEAPKRINKPSPLTPPQSMNNSFDSLYNARPLSRTSTQDSGKFGLGKIADSGWTISGLSIKDMELPTRRHWKADSEASVCDETTCKRAFSYFNRRHHCRKCGNIFCDVHSQQAVPLDTEAQFDPDGAYSRACDYCFDQFRSWDMARLSRSNSGSETSEDQQQQLSSPTTPTMPAMTPVLSCGERPKHMMVSVFGGVRKDGTPESMGQSVPRDWNWSTF